MITAVDTNVILDVVIPDEQFGRQSREWLAEAYDVGSVIVCDIVYAELVPVFSNQSTLDGVLRQIDIRGSSINLQLLTSQDCESRSAEAEVAREHVL